MIKHIKTIILHPLISGSSVLFVGSFLANGLNYLFNLAMGRLLSVSDYGLLISLTALVVLLTLLYTPLTTIFTKLAAKYFATKNKPAISHLIWSGTKISIVVSVIYLVILILSSVFISRFLHINNPFLLLIIFLSVVFSLLHSLPSGILQGGLHFFQVSIITVSGTFIKIIIGISLVFLGYGVVGGSIGILSAFVVPYVFSSIYIVSKYGIKIGAASEFDFLKEFKKFSGPFFLASIAITILQGTDVIFARHFLSNFDAGLFAGLSLIGKAIFYITSPIYFAFFPIIAHKKEKKDSTSGTLFLASAIVLSTSLAFTALYFVAPHFIIQIFFSAPSYQLIAPYLGFYSLYISIFSFAFLLNNYFLSVGRVGVYKLNWVASIFYIILILFFHSSIAQFITVLISSALLLLIFLLVYYKRYEAN